MNVSFIIPAYNCATTIEETVKSIVDCNAEPGDEVMIVNDASTDSTSALLHNMAQRYPLVRIVTHPRNKGGGAARNTAVENSRHPLIFCLDSDNVLASNSVPRLKDFLLSCNADVAAFQELHYFKDRKEEVTHKWIFADGVTTFADYLAGAVVPGASGNYLFTRESWVRAKGYPEFAGALDAWGFGLRQVATGAKMVIMPRTYYFHRYGHESYWVRESKGGATSLRALQILIPFLDMIADRDVDYIMSRQHRYTWFENLDRRPLRVRSGAVGRAGHTTMHQTAVSRLSLLRRVKNRIRHLTC